MSQRRTLSPPAGFLPDGTDERPETVVAGNPSLAGPEPRSPTAPPEGHLSRASSTADPAVGKAPPDSRVLLAAADPDARERWRQALAERLPDCADAATAEDLGAALAERPPELILLEPAFPDGCGLDVLAGQPGGYSPGLVVFDDCANPDRWLEVVRRGADLVLPRAVNAQLLDAVVGNLLGRIVPVGPRDAWQLDCLRWSLLSPHGRQVRLSHREQSLLACLCETPGQAVPREAILAALGVDPKAFDLRRLEILVRRLRTKVRAEAAQELPLTTVNGVGYAFTAPAWIARDA